MAYLQFKSKYECFPKTKVEEDSCNAWQGYENIVSEIKKNKFKVLVIDCYHGVNYEELNASLVSKLDPVLIINSDDAAFTATEIKDEVADNITDDRVFGVMSFHKLQRFFYLDKIKEFQNKIANTDGIVIVYGVGASFITKGDILIYADMLRWEIQLRFRSGQLANWRDDNFSEDILRRYKRGYFLEWRWMDEHKKEIINDIHYYLDTTIQNDPKMITLNAYNKGLDKLVSQPFRLKPYFDQGVWGGQWIKEVCNLDQSVPNYAWGFDGVPEENSVLLQYGDIVIDIPAINLVFEKPIQLLGERLYECFGAEFPIRFDFLDTMQGQNLSLQVHPTVEYAYKNFGIRYTQDESYYILDTAEGAKVYLGLKEEIDPEGMIAALRVSENSKEPFLDKKYVNEFPCKKHDHILIPAGTIHCSGTNSVVLEISATPYIFTFKLWDWDRVGLDGLPRPVHINHGEKVINWSRTTNWVKENLLNQITVLEDNKDFMCEKTGLHSFEFIETYRYTVHTYVLIKTRDSVNMLNLIDGEEIKITCPNNSFEPLIINYAETFIVPEQCKEYIITPINNSVGKSIKVIQAYVK